MSFLGMGFMEILIILIIAFIFLGPERMIDAAKMLGRLVREARSIASEIPRVVVEDDDIKIVNGGETTSLTGQGQPAQPPAKPPATARAAEPEADADAEAPDGGGAPGPVAFSRRSPPDAENGENRPDRNDR